MKLASMRVSANFGLTATLLDVERGCYAMKITTRELQDPARGQSDLSEGVSGHLLAITVKAPVPSKDASEFRR